MRKGTRALSMPKKKLSGSLFLLLFGAVFTAAGGALLWFLLLSPLVQWQEAQSWVETACTIVQSEVTENHGDSTTYGIHIAYEYGFKDVSFRSDRYNFTDFSSAGRARKEAVVAQFPAGSLSTCYVNPQNPGEAVLSRAFSWAYLIGLFGLPFLGIGLACLATILRTPRHQVKSAETPEETVHADFIELRPEQTRLTKLIISVIAALVWNGVVAVMFFSLKEDWEHDRDYIFAAFTAAFGLAGLGLLCASVYQALALLNPQVLVRLGPLPLRLGGTATLDWTLTGGVERLRSFRVLLVGQEEATYQRGTDTTTDRKVFERHVILETEATADMRTGRVQFVVPEKIMHSFAAKNNKIKWFLNFEGSIDHWPDLADEFSLQVLPRQMD